MDPLLKLLEESSLGLSVDEFYAGGFLHADDIRTLATSNDSIVQQAELVEKFAATNFLKLKKARKAFFSYRVLFREF